ncbi:MAG: glycosyltransferase family 4 protein [Rhodothermales bacterium]
MGQGGAERQFYYMLRSLAQTNADVRLLCTTQGEFWEEPIRKLGYPMSWLGNANTRLGRLSLMLRLLESSPPDVIQSTHTFTNLYTAVSARVLGARGIGAVRASLANGYRAIGRFSGYVSLRAPHVIAVNSEAALQDAIRSGIPRRKLFYLPNVVDVEHFQPGQRVSTNHVKILAVGRLVEEKRFDRFIDVIALLRKQMGRCVKGAIIGDGPLLRLLQQQAEVLELNDDALKFVGAVEDVAPIYNEADIFVLTSASEGTPNVVLEAMAAGLPVVATNVGDVGRLLSDGETGFILDSWDPEKASMALAILAEDAGLRRTMGKRGRRQVMATRSHRNLLQYLDGLYTFALDRPIRL